MRITITADDIGALKSINSAVEKLINQEIINSISVFVNGNTDLSWVPKYISIVKIGLHLTFSFGKPISDLSDEYLVSKTGDFFKPIFPYLASNTTIQESIKDFTQYFSQSNQCELERECIAQYEKFISLFSKKPDFINVHHDLDSIFHLKEVLQTLFPNKLTRASKTDTNKHYFYLYNFLDSTEPYEISKFRIKSLLNQAINLSRKSPSNEVEVVFHPAFLTKELFVFSTYAEMRQREYEILSSEGYFPLLEEELEI